MTKRMTRLLMLGASPLVVLIASGTPVFAQSTGTQAIETVVVTGARAVNEGILSDVKVSKERSTITQEYLDTQSPGQTIFESLNSVPGYNFTNTDPYGASGGDVRLHGFEGARISFTWDGMPLNDTGNYAIFTNQVADPEVIASVSVNQGTTDVDSPTASAVGGVISYLTTKPKDTPGVMLDSSAGSYAQDRFYGRVDTGEFGPWGTTAFVSGSYQHYDKFKGPGYEQKKQGNAYLYQDLGPLGWMSLGFHFNSNRNDFYNGVSFLPINAARAYSSAVAAGTSPNPSTQAGVLAVGAPNVALDSSGNYTGVITPGTSIPLGGFGLGFDEDPSCTRPTAVAGTAQNEATTATGTTATCTGFYGIRINPSDTGNIRGASLFHLTDDLALTFDPSFQYVLANGGGIQIINENDPRLIGNTTGKAGVDLNGDGDVLDRIAVYAPNNTYTRRYGVNTSLLWTPDKDNALQVAYTLDYGLHIQTGQYAFMQANGQPYDVFAGYRDVQHRVLDADGSTLRGRDRKSRAILNQFSAAYDGKFFDDSLVVSLGARLPFFERDLNQKCYVQATGSFTATTPGTNFQYCTTATPSALAANGTVTFAGIPAATATFTPPGTETVRYNRFLPSAGLSYYPFGEDHQFFASFAEGLSAPRTDSLYNGGNNGGCAASATAAGCVFSSFENIRPETTNSYDIGYRYTGDIISGSITAYNTQFKNRIVTTFDPTQGISVDHNVGSVNLDGVDAEASIHPMEHLSWYSSASYTHTRVSAGPLSTVNLNAAGTVSVSIAGKELVETPNWLLYSRAQYEIWGFRLGLAGKYVGRRFGTDTNDYRVPGYFVMNGDITYDLGQLGWEGSYIKIDGQNLLNKKYFGNISTTRTCFTPIAPTTSGCTSYPLLNVGSPQVFEFTLRTEF